MANTPFGPEYPNLNSYSNKTTESIGYLGDSDFRYYEVKKGGMGEVYICSLKDGQHDGTKLALKTFKKEFFFYPECRTEFLKEAALWASLSGIPNIMPLFNITFIQQRPFIVMPAIIIDGKTTLRDHLIQNTRQPTEFVYKVIYQVLFGLSIAASKIPGISHGDLKPENIIIAGDILITDFGLANAEGISRKYYGPRTISTTYAYKAPELWEGNIQGNALSDIYAIGIIMYELLNGKLPFEGSNAQEWKELHNTVIIDRTHFEITSDFENALVDICLNCFSKNPLERPSSYAELFKILTASCEKFDIITSLQTLVYTHDRQVFYDNLQKELKPGIISSLLEIGEYELALKQFASIDQIDFDKELWLRYGVTLSLNNNENDAIAAYKKALSANKDDTEFEFRVMFEYALALKHLHQYDAAEEIYCDLLPKIQQKQLPNVILNLASIYYVKKDYKRAIDLIRNSMTDLAGHAMALKSLGIAYYYNEDTTNAIQYFKLYLSENTADADSQAYLGYCYFMAGDIHHANSCFDMSIDQGYNSETLFIHLLASAYVKNSISEVNELVSILHRDCDEITIKRLLNSSKNIFNWFIDKYDKKIQKPFPFFDDDIDDAGEMVTVQNNILETLSESEGQESHTFSMPFLNTRFYVEENMFSIDFYHLPNDENYISHFEKAYNTATRNMQYDMGEQMLFRITPLYFTNCDHCKQEILTNRDEGKSLACRKCNERFITKRLANNPTLDSLLSRVNLTIGRNVIEEATELIILIAQHPDNEKLKEIERFCNTHGFTTMDSELPLIFYILSPAAKSGQVDLGVSFIAVSKKCVSKNFYEGTTPSEVEMLLRVLRPKYADLKTCSSSLSAEQVDDKSTFNLFLWGKYEELEKIITKKIVEQEADYDDINLLSNVYLKQEKYQEALAMSDLLMQHLSRNTVSNEMIINTYSHRAKVLLKLKNYNEAIILYERCFKMDPIDRNVVLGLANCYYHQNDHQNASKYYSILKGLGN